MIKILSIDDHFVFGIGLKQAISAYSDQFEVSFESDPIKAMSYLMTKPDVDLIIIDLNMPGIDGLSMIKNINEIQLFIPVAVMSAAQDLHLYSEALSLGAMGIIPKTSTPEEIIDAIQTLYRGETYIPANYAASLRLMTKFSKENTDSMLSKRQLEILNLVRNGLSNKDIASALFISELTVKSHLRATFKILQVKNRTECVKKAEEHDMI